MRFSLCIICPLACSVEKTYTVGYLLRKYLSYYQFLVVTICPIQLLCGMDYTRNTITAAYKNVLFSKINKNKICVLDIPFIKLRSDSRCYYRDITSRCNSFDAIMKRVVHIGQKNHVYITLNNDKVDQM